MQKDVAECQGLATRSSGYSPTAPPPSATSDERYEGGRVKGGATGAAAGRTAAHVRGTQHEGAYDQFSDEAKREYRKNEGQPAAAAGAGASKQRRDRREGHRDEKDAEKQAKAAAEAYDQANRSCLDGRGYSVTP